MLFLILPFLCFCDILTNSVLSPKKPWKFNFNTKMKGKNKKIAQEPRDSGIELVGKIPWGTHFCQFYKTKKDLADILVPYFKAGLLNNEMCVWVTSEFLTNEEALAALRKELPDADEYLRRGQIEIFSHTEWYLKSGKFEMNTVLKKWVQKHDKAIKRGFSGMRVSGNPFWIDNKKDWDDFAAYEAQINNVIDSYKLLVLCTYSLEKCGSNEIIDVVATHEFAMIKQNGDWRLIETDKQKKAKKELEESQAQLQAIVKNLNEGIVVSDLKGNLIQWNDAALKMHGFKKSEEPNCPLAKLADIFKLSTLNEEPVSLNDWPLARVLRGEALDGLEMRVERLDGTQRKIFDYSGSLIKNVKGRPFMALITVKDVTEQKKEEIRIRNFLAILGHELRNPLSPISLSLDLLKTKKIQDPDITETIEIVNHQVDIMTRLLKDLLDVSRINRGKIELQKKDFQINSAVRNVKKTVEFLMRENRQKLEISGLKGGLVIFADQMRLEQILVNLLSNASKYSKAGTTIKIRLERKKNRLFIKIKDSGIGITKERQEQIFNLFSQYEQAWSNKKGGLGIGLYLGRELARLHGGDLSVRSKGLNQGSEFTLSVPLKNKTAGNLKESKPKPNGRHDLKVLTVDDNKILADTILRVLKFMGCEAKAAYSGEAALKLLKKFDPSVALIDLGMPKIDGLDLAKEIIKNKRLKISRLVALTGSGEDINKKAAKEAGFNYFVVKPVKISDLETILAGKADNFKL